MHFHCVDKNLLTLVQIFYYQSAWKSEQEKKEFTPDDIVKGNGNDINSKNQRVALDLMQLMPAAYEEVRLTNSFAIRGNRVDDERDAVRRYIGKAHELSQMDNNDSSVELASDKLFSSSRIEIERAMRKPSAQRFLVSILSQRGKFSFITKPKY